MWESVVDFLELYDSRKDKKIKKIKKDMLFYLVIFVILLPFTSLLHAIHYLYINIH